MIKKHLLDARRIRRIDGGFSFIPHRFLTDGFLSALGPISCWCTFSLCWRATDTGFPFTAAIRSAGCLKSPPTGIFRPETL